MSGVRHIMRTALCALLLAVAVASALFCATPAWAEGEESSGNQVYVGQLSDSSFLYETSIADLAQASAYYEGLNVLVSGEVVGDRVNDETNGSRCWITLQDDAESPSTIAVVMDKAQTDAIDTYGRYGQKGTTLQVFGTFHLSCRDHQGMSDIHAESASALEQGEADAPDVDRWVLIAGVGTVVLGLVLLALYQVRRERTL